MLRYTLLLWIVLFHTMASTAQQILPLYPPGSRIPYNLDKTPEELSTKYPDGRLDAYNRVIVPNLTLFTPQGQPNGKSILILPGGGYRMISFDREGLKIADYLTKRGYTAFVLKYRMPDTTVVRAEERSAAPLADAIQAMLVIKQNAAALSLDTGKIGVMGFSAGGHLAASLSTLYNRHRFGTPAARPAFAILIYPVITSGPARHVGSFRSLLGARPQAGTDTLFSVERQVRADTPPTFIVHSQDDQAVPVENALLYAEALRRRAVPFEAHIFPKGGHGYNLAENIPGTRAWPSLLDAWLAGL